MIASEIDGLWLDRLYILCVYRMNHVLYDMIRFEFLKWNDTLMYKPNIDTPAYSKVRVSSIQREDGWNRLRNSLLYSGCRYAHIDCELSSHATSNYNMRRDVFHYLLSQLRLEIVHDKDDWYHGTSNTGTQRQKLHGWTREKGRKE